MEYCLLKTLYTLKYINYLCIVRLIALWIIVLSAWNSSGCSVINNGGRPRFDMELSARVCVSACVRVCMCMRLTSASRFMFNMTISTLVLFTCSAAVFFCSLFLFCYKVRAHCSVMPVRFPNKTQPPPEHHCPTFVFFCFFLIWYSWDGNKIIPMTVDFTFYLV